jgi:4,5-DOPA dioxygenase extradiol
VKRIQFLHSIIAGTVVNAITSLNSLAKMVEDQPRTSKMPVLFIGHGSPMNALEENEFTLQWKKLRANLPRPNAILCISAHWLTRGSFVTGMEKPKTIHDFGGFPQELFDVEYPAIGDLDLAKELTKNKEFTEIGLNHSWGLDHGTWSVLRPMYPEADIPVIQLSIDYAKGPEFHYNLGQTLSYLRNKGILIIGSGNMIHNLAMIGFPKGIDPDYRNLNQEYGYDWALELNETLKNHIKSKSHHQLIHYDKLGKSAKMAIPTPDHYYPLLYALALQDKDDDISIFNDKCIGGSLSMTSLQIG